MKLDVFTQAYIECALWSSTDDKDQPLDTEYSQSDLAPETLAQMVADCQRFQAVNAEYFLAGTSKKWPSPSLSHIHEVEQQAGHDFWLTRNGHGAGFWDGDWSEPAATTLTKAAHAYGEFELYVGDNGRIYA